VSGADFAKLTATAGTVSIGYGLLPTTTGPSLIPTLHIAIQTGASVDAAIQLFDNGQVSPTNIPGVADTSAQVFGHLDAMQALVDANALWAVHVTDTATAAVSLSATHAAADLGALSITSGHYALTIADSASNVAANLDALQALAGGGHLAQIDAAGAVNITAAQWQADGDAVARISATGPITAALSGAHTQYTVAQGSSGLTISGNGVTESLGNVDRVAFSDGYLAFDIHGDAGQAYRLYQAAFNRVPDVAGLGFNIHSLDVGLSLADVAQQFISSAEFQHTYGNPDDDAWVTLLYQNVLHRAPEQAGFAFHLWELSVGLTRAQQLAEFSESPENQANVIGQIQNGIFYTLPAS
jgi:hypothetical protein